MRWAAMKHDRLPGILAVGFAFALCACGSSQVQVAKAPAPTPNAVGTTQLMAAEMHLTEPAAKVGKSQHDVITDEAVRNEEEDPITAKDQPRRKDHSPHSRGSGFSGWK
jgi:hypothetical protein